MSDKAAELSLQILINKSKTLQNYNIVTIEGTVDTGFEGVALEECIEIFGSEVECCRSRGRIFFNIVSNTANIDKLRKMRSVDNLYQIINAENIEFDGKDKDADLSTVKDIVNRYNFKQDILLWAERMMAYNGICFPTSEQSQKALAVNTILKEKASKKGGGGDTKVEDSESADGLKKDSEEIDIDKMKISEELPQNKDELDQYLRDNELNVLKFRATCNRVGKHSFSSMEAARDFGGQLHDNYMWLVDLKYYDLEVVLNICDKEVYIGLALTRESMHKRNITHFGPTTLRATLCYNLLRLARPQPGDLVVDPLCGGGSIPFECSLAFPYVFNICGDNHEKAVNRTLCNLTSLESVYNKPLPLDVFQWDAARLPLRSASVDIFTTDLPFGKRSGRKIDNVPLYRRVLNELTRVVRLESGRAVLMTHDRKAFTKVLSNFSQYWTNPHRIGINLGGLDAAVFVLRRTAKMI
ncbi:THUMP domain-containing protein 3-like [Nilaparvata lugens]|uniref:THUMP domain-containing protein 3-like n=1 Tax=Nilaparvata lugens TaxID=108931 RepID=UPI00193DE834|nr:THUMP domain-containing protein 3-like [Nilaparvata lugens]